ncbi:MAG TPA: PIN domain-containing protein [Bacteroidota bacterium]|nr:PIN domain-containing protein [Bacteroidota bacterium]
MEVVIDSHALFWFITNNSKLSERAKKAIQEASVVVVPSIVVMEILYIFEKHNLAHRFVDFLGELKVRKYLIYPLDIEVIAQTVAIPHDLEMHDRIILATAQLIDAPLLTKDREIKKYYSKTIGW